jgi:hypothetical protein
MAGRFTILEPLNLLNLLILLILPICTAVRDWPSGEARRGADRAADRTAR